MDQVCAPADAQTTIALAIGGYVGDCTARCKQEYRNSELFAILVLRFYDDHDYLRGHGNDDNVQAALAGGFQLSERYAKILPQATTTETSQKLSDTLPFNSSTQIEL